MTTESKPLSDALQALPHLRENEAHVWIVEVPVADSGQTVDIDVLEPSERDRASQFRFAIDRAAFVRRRVALRVILSRYLDISPRDIAFTVTKFGKPSVVPPYGRPSLSFNTSHSATLAAIAITRSGRVGIDIERVLPFIEAESIAARLFAPGEAEVLAALRPYDRVQGFFNAWTRKEAVIKALGKGLSIPLDSFEVSLLPDEPPAILRWDIPGEAHWRWRIHHLEPALGYVGALAVDCEVSAWQCWRWPT